MIFWYLKHFHGCFLLWASCKAPLGPLKPWFQTPPLPRLAQQSLPPRWGTANDMQMYPTEVVKPQVPSLRFTHAFSYIMTFCDSSSIQAFSQKVFANSFVTRTDQGPAKKTKGQKHMQNICKPIFYISMKECKNMQKWILQTWRDIQYTKVFCDVKTMEPVSFIHAPPHGTDPHSQWAAARLWGAQPQHTIPNMMPYHHISSLFFLGMIRIHVEHLLYMDPCGHHSGAQAFCLSALNLCSIGVYTFTGAGSCWFHVCMETAAKNWWHAIIQLHDVLKALAKDPTKQPILHGVKLQAFNDWPPLSQLPRFFGQSCAWVADKQSQRLWK